MHLGSTYLSDIKDSLQQGANTCLDGWRKVLEINRGVASHYNVLKRTRNSGNGNDITFTSHQEKRFSTTEQAVLAEVPVADGFNQPNGVADPKSGSLASDKGPTSEPPGDTRRFDLAPGLASPLLEVPAIFSENLERQFKALR